MCVYTIARVGLAPAGRRSGCLRKKPVSRLTYLTDEGVGKKLNTCSCGKEAEYHVHEKRCRSVSCVFVCVHSHL